VIVLDLMMPDVNGFDVVAALNEHPDTARIPIIVVTAKQITGEDRAKLSGYVTAVMEKAKSAAIALPPSPTRHVGPHCRRLTWENPYRRRQPANMTLAVFLLESRVTPC
jgi:chemotaxis response regulator CheB